jgi:hypothetical protein
MSWNRIHLCTTDVMGAHRRPDLSTHALCVVARADRVTSATQWKEPRVRPPVAYQTGTFVCQSPSVIYTADRSAATFIPIGSAFVRADGRGQHR